MCVIIPIRAACFWASFNVSSARISSITLPASSNPLLKSEQSILDKYFSSIIFEILDATSNFSLNVTGSSSLVPKISINCWPLSILPKDSAIWYCNSAFCSSVNACSLALYSLNLSNIFLDAGFIGSALYISGISLMLLVWIEFLASFIFTISPGLTSTTPSFVNIFVHAGKIQKVPDAHFLTEIICHGTISDGWINFILSLSKSSERTYKEDNSSLGPNHVSIGFPSASRLKIYITSDSDKALGYQSLLLWYHFQSSFFMNPISLNWASSLKFGKKASLGAEFASIEILVDSIIEERATNIPSFWTFSSNSKILFLSLSVRFLFFLYNSLSSEKIAEFSDSIQLIISLFPLFELEFSVNDNFKSCNCWIFTLGIFIFQTMALSSMFITSECNSLFFCICHISCSLFWLFHIHGVFIANHHHATNPVVNAVTIAVAAKFLRFQSAFSPSFHKSYWLLARIFMIFQAASCTSSWIISSQISLHTFFKKSFQTAFKLCLDSDFNISFM